MQQKHDNDNITERHSSKRKRQSSSSESEEADNQLHTRNDAEQMVNISNLLLEMMPQYSTTLLPLDTPKRMLTQEETLVYSGNEIRGDEVPSLFNSCAKVIENNIDAIEYTGGVPYFVLKTILEKATPDQLLNVELYNPYLIEDTDELWRLHCMQAFRIKKREETVTWREMYKRCLDEREAKLNLLAYIAKAKNGIISPTPLKSSTSLKLSALATAREASKESGPNPGRRPVD